MSTPRADSTGCFLEYTFWLPRGVLHTRMLPYIIHQVVVAAHDPELANGREWRHYIRNAAVTLALGLS